MQFTCPRCGAKMVVIGTMVVKQFQEYDWDGATEYVDAGDFLEESGPSDRDFYISIINCEDCGYEVGEEDIKMYGPVSGKAVSSEEALRDVVESLIAKTVDKHGIEN